MAGVPVRRVADPGVVRGPLVRLRAGLEAATEPIVLAVGGDMPAMRAPVLAALVRALLAADALDGRGRPRDAGRLVPLPAALRTGRASDEVGRLVDDGERRLRSLFTRLPTRVLDDVEWRPLDPGRATPSATWTGPRTSDPGGLAAPRTPRPWGNVERVRRRTDAFVWEEGAGSRDQLRNGVVGRAAKPRPSGRGRAEDRP